MKNVICHFYSDCNLLGLDLTLLILLFCYFESFLYSVESFEGLIISTNNFKLDFCFSIVTIECKKINKSNPTVISDIFKNMLGFSLVNIRPLLLSYILT